MQNHLKTYRLQIETRGSELFEVEFKAFDPASRPSWPSHGLGDPGPRNKPPSNCRSHALFMVLSTKTEVKQ